MSKRTVSAAGGAMPAGAPQSDRPDAALFALAEECIAASREHDKTLDRVEAAEKRHRPVPPPAPVLKTEKDARLGLYVGPSADEAYDREEIAAIRVFCRAQGVKPCGSSVETAAYFRGIEILDAWADWQEKVAREEERSGLAAATRADIDAAHKFDAVAGKLATTPASTVDGILAKTRATLSVFIGDDGIAKSIREGLRRYGPNDDDISMSLARDLIRLVKSEGVAK